MYYYRSGTGGRCCVWAVNRSCVCTYQAAALFCVKRRHGRRLRLRRHRPIRNRISTQTDRQTTVPCQ